MFVRRSVDSGDDGGGPMPSGGEFGSRWPAIWEYLWLSRWEDGTSRETSTLRVFSDRGMCKACLCDRANAVNCWISGRDPFEVLDALESALRGGTAEWVPDAYKKRK